MCRVVSGRFSNWDFHGLASVDGLLVAGTHLVDGKVEVDRGHYPVSELFVDDALQSLRASTEP